MTLNSPAGFLRRAAAALLDALVLGLIAALVLPVASHFIDLACCIQEEYALSRMQWGYALAAGVLMFIDSLMVMQFPCMFVHAIAGWIAPSLRSVSEFYTPGNTSAYAIGLVINWFYHAFMESSSHQATFGKRCLKIMVTTLSGEKLSFRQATSRHFAKAFLSFPIGLGLYFTSISTGDALPIFAVTVLATFLPVILTRKKQCLQDLSCKCLVVKAQGQDCPQASL